MGKQVNEVACGAPFEASPFRSRDLPEPICSSVAPQVCQPDEPEPLVCTAPPPGATSRASTSPPTPPAVERLVKNHPSTQQQAACTGERLALAAAAAKTALSLAKVVASAPTEVGLAYTVTDFILESAALGATAAEYVNCKEARKD